MAAILAAMYCMYVCIAVAIWGRCWRRVTPLPLGGLGGLPSNFEILMSKRVNFRPLLPKLAPNYSYYTGEY